MSARTQLAEELQSRLGDDYKVHAFDTNLGPIDAALSAVIVVDAPTYAPITSSALNLGFKLHVITPFTDPERVATQFDAVLDELFAVIDSIPNLVWTDAQPSNFDEQKPSYVIQTTTRAKKE